MAGVPELDVRWRRFSLSVKGTEAINAVRKPLFVLLLLNGVVAMLALVVALIRPNWPAISAIIAAWLR